MIYYVFYIHPTSFLLRLPLIQFKKARDKLLQLLLRTEFLVGKSSLKHFKGTEKKPQISSYARNASEFNKVLFSDKYVKHVVFCNGLSATHANY